MKSVCPNAADAEIHLTVYADQVPEILIQASWLDFEAFHATFPAIPMKSA